jgi:hypothetical protein
LVKPNDLLIVRLEESLFPIITPRLLEEVLGELQGPIAIYTDGS